MRPTRKELSPVSVDDIRVFEATEGSTDSSPLLLGVETVLLWPSAAPGDRRRGGPFYDEMAQGRGGEELAMPHSRGRQEQQPRETGRAGGGSSRTDTQL